MSIRALMTRTCTIRHVTADGGHDRYGNPTRTSSATSVPCWHEQTSLSEQQGGEDRSTSRHTLWLPANTVIGPSDRVVLDDGRTYEVYGQPDDMAAPAGSPNDHLEVQLRLVTGG